MCSIIGIFNARNVKKTLALGMKEMHFCRRDFSGVFIKGRSGIGSLLPAVSGFVKQPIQKSFVADCRIYNWQELCRKHNISAGGDAEALFLLLKRKGVKILGGLDGVFAFAFWSRSKVILAHDVLGEKPLWFALQGRSFAFASEKKALVKAGFGSAEELHPRKILFYDVKKNKLTFSSVKFLSPAHVSGSFEAVKSRLKELLVSAVRKRIPSGRAGVLFSGGVDSSAVAVILKNLGVKFACYTAFIENSGAEDLEWAEKSARALGFDLRPVKVKLSEVGGMLADVVPLVENSSAVNVGVALPLFAACRQAGRDGVNVVFSGSGSDELFGGYKKQGFNLNEECFYRLKNIYYPDLYRDSLVSMFNSVELRSPFLDRALAEYALGIPAEYKDNAGVKKYILRKAVSELGLSDFAFRGKKAAQYGSRFDWALEKLAKSKGLSKSMYLKGFSRFPNMRLGVLFSSGKDSAYAALTMRSMNYELACFITMKSKNPDSYMFHTPNVWIVPLQAEAAGLPLIIAETAGEKEQELDDLADALKKAKKKFGIGGVVTGALFSSYQRSRIEGVCEKLGLKCFSPLWHKSQESEMREVINAGFKFVFSSIAAEGLDSSWLGRVLTNSDLPKLFDISRKHGFNPAGEGGEFESLVLDCPLFRKRIKILESEIVMESRNAGRFIVKRAVLEEKQPLK